MFTNYVGFNPWIDVAVVTVFGIALAVIGYVAERHNAKQKKKLRGATRC